MVKETLGVLCPIVFCYVDCCLFRLLGVLPFLFPLSLLRCVCGDWLFHRRFFSLFFFFFLVHTHAHARTEDNVLSLLQGRRRIMRRRGLRERLNRGADDEFFFFDCFSFVRDAKVDRGTGHCSRLIIGGADACLLNST